VTPASFIGEALIGWLLADLIAGVVHWLEDRVLSPRLPGLRSIIAAQRLHHASPQAFAAGGLIARNGTTWAAAGVVSIVWAIAFGLSVTWAVATLGGLLASQAHFYAHCPRHAGPIVRVLQDVGLLQSAKHHAAHHRPPHATRYCPLTDLLNPVLDALGVWTRLEQLLRIAPEPVR
jgi:ubiquitin-conjugating enzyme E2 variant